MRSSMLGFSFEETGSGSPLLPLVASIMNKQTTIPTPKAIMAKYIAVNQTSRNIGEFGIMHFMTSCILLSAGLSTRFGSAKALAKLGDQTVIECLLKTLVESDLAEIIVVLGAHADKIKPHILNHTKVKVVYNKDYILGQTSSVKAGVEALDPKSRSEERRV